MLRTTDPVELIFNGLTIKRPKPKIKEKLLELGLATDRKELRKKRSRKSNHGECSPSLSFFFIFFFILSSHPVAVCIFPFFPSALSSTSNRSLKHPQFRPILSHSIRICLSYHPLIRRLFLFDQSSPNTIAIDCI